MKLSFKIVILAAALTAAIAAPRCLPAREFEVLEARSPPEGNYQLNKHGFKGPMYYPAQASRLQQPHSQPSYQNHHTPVYDMPHYSNSNRPVAYHGYQPGGQHPQTQHPPVTDHRVHFESVTHSYGQVVHITAHYPDGSHQTHVFHPKGISYRPVYDHDDGHVVIHESFENGKEVKHTFQAVSGKHEAEIKRPGKPQTTETYIHAPYVAGNGRTAPYLLDPPIHEVHDYGRVVHIPMTYPDGRPLVVHHIVGGKSYKLIRSSTLQVDVHEDHPDEEHIHSYYTGSHYTGSHYTG